MKSFFRLAVLLCMGFVVGSCGRYIAVSLDSNVRQKGFNSFKKGDSFCVEHCESKNDLISKDALLADELKSKIEKELQRQGFIIKDSPSEAQYVLRF